MELAHRNENFTPVVLAGIRGVPRRDSLRYPGVDVGLRQVERHGRTNPSAVQVDVAATALSLVVPELISEQEAGFTHTEIEDRPAVEPRAPAGGPGPRCRRRRECRGGGERTAK